MRIRHGFGRLILYKSLLQFPFAVSCCILHDVAVKVLESQPNFPDYFIGHYADGNDEVVK